MLLPRLLRCPKLGRLTALGKTPFELRFNIHYCFIPLAIALCIHAERLLVLTLVATCAWMSDYAYQVVFRTFRLDVVEFTRLKDGGVQARDRSRDSDGTSPLHHSNTLTYIHHQLPPASITGAMGKSQRLHAKQRRVRQDSDPMATREPEPEPELNPNPTPDPNLSLPNPILTLTLIRLPEPWGSQWHPFSLYLKEATATGLSVINAPGEELAESNSRAFPGPQAKGGSEIVPSSTALLMIEFQNEFASDGGKLHPAVKDVMDSLDMLAKCQRLCAAARQSGAKVFHVPISFEKHDGSDNPNAKLGILKGCQDDQLFRAHSWGADFHPMMSPAPGDVVIRGKRGLDSFPGTDLKRRLREHGIETVVLGGFLTNCCVESTMRTAFEQANYKL